MHPDRRRDLLDVTTIKSRPDRVQALLDHRQDNQSQSRPPRVPTPPRRTSASDWPNRTSVAYHLAQECRASPGTGQRREVVRDRLVHHSDKGSQYTSLRFTQRLADAGVAPSTGSVGDSYDNAMAESFFSTIKTELIYRHTWNTRHEAELAIFAWIEGWYNPERIMLALGMRSPDEYEAAFYASTHHPTTAEPAMVGSQ
jgi:transposase InsO family protein